MIRFDREKDVSFISVRFKSGAFRHFYPIPFSDLNDNYYSFKTLWRKKGEELLDKLESEPKIEVKIKEIELFLKDIFFDYHNKENDKWDKIIDQLYYSFNDNSILKLSQKANLSLRQFERAFKHQFGITAKYFQKITRFQEAIKSLLLNKNSNYLDTILKNGYFDQSHFIKEFKSLTEKTPLEYFTYKNFNCHFYHKSINNNAISSL